MVKVMRFPKKKKKKKGIGHDSKSRYATGPGSAGRILKIHFRHFDDITTGRLGQMNDSDKI